jgi:LuxR family maltose regulon positive regulatory protein
MKQGCFVYLKYLISAGLTAEADRLAVKAARSVEASGSTGTLVSVRCHQALVSSARGDEAEARRFLEDALGLAESEYLVRPFIDAGGGLVRLLQAAESDHPFAAAVLEEMEPDEPPQATRLDVDQLSRRELDVISLIAEGKSNQQIADGLYISLGTVKWHVNNIFGKLNVKSRTAALIKARDIGLI